ncbi:GNAT family N-acetyltransferase [Companilactobacillus allii]|uniref:GNAT family N-acetyltransferase n=2 Tax=Companilactobacillus allii TaxID=1847728 RepID=A0A1P8Q2V4_9LACO|nr:GNAT family N-acetyltransferase [Companilactobacillus allii]APX72156.1 GNAT family N-acetyltransferase [Companilactobacillus allii]
MQEIKYTTDLNSKSYQDGLNIRKQVFIKEQGVSESLEISDEDKCEHVTLYSDGLAVATARFFVTDDNGIHIQRVAVLKEYRHKNLATNLLTDMITKIKKNSNNYKYIILGAQDHAQEFYIKLGFKVIGDQYTEAGILHHDMKLTLGDNY